MGGGSMGMAAVIDAATRSVPAMMVTTMASAAEKRRPNDVRMSDSTDLGMGSMCSRRVGVPERMPWGIHKGGGNRDDPVNLAYTQGSLQAECDFSGAVHRRSGFAPAGTESPCLIPWRVIHERRPLHEKDWRWNRG